LELYHMQSPPSTQIPSFLFDMHLPCILRFVLLQVSLQLFFVTFVILTPVHRFFFFISLGTLPNFCAKILPFLELFFGNFRFHHKSFHYFRLHNIIE